MRAAVTAAGFDLAVEQEKDGAVCLTGLVEGRAADVVALLSRFQVEDLVFAEPDLEETVLGIYSGEEEN